MVMNTPWNEAFAELFREAVARYYAGCQRVETLFTEGECEFLSQIGCAPHVLFNWVQLYSKSGSPSPTTCLLLVAVRRDFMKQEQEGAPYSGPTVLDRQLPAFRVEFSGMPYLPRIIAKAQAYLLGAMGKDLVYPCENDQKFLREHGDIDCVDFLKLVWLTKADSSKIYDFVRENTPSHIISSEQE